MDVIFSVVLVSAIVTVPLKMAASWLGARRDSYGACALASIVALIGDTIVSIFFEKGFIGFVVAVLVVGVIMGVILQTTLWNGIKINFVGMLLMLLLLPFFMGFFAVVAAIFL